MLDADRQRAQAAALLVDSLIENDEGIFELVGVDVFRRGTAPNLGQAVLVWDALRQF